MVTDSFDQRYVLSFRMNGKFKVIQIQKYYKNKRGSDYVLDDVPTKSRQRLLKELKENLS